MSPRRPTSNDAGVWGGVAGKDWWGRQRAEAARNIVVEHCRVTRGHAVSVGSETSGGIYNVLFDNIELAGEAKQVS